VFDVREDIKYQQRTHWWNPIHLNQCTRSQNVLLTSNMKIVATA